MVLKIHGDVVSTCTKRVLTVCEELDVPYEVVSVNFAKREHKLPEFVAVQPFGQIPYLDDDGFILFESRAIARYIALKYGGGKLIPSPSDFQHTALFEQAASIELTNFDPSASGLAIENIFKQKYFGLNPDEVAIAGHKATLEGKLAAYDVILGKTRYLAGEEVTLADLFHLSFGTLLAAQGYDYLESPKFPNVARWWKDISTRPSWKKITWS